jgi:Lar family restriction alleviation protein
MAEELKACPFCGGDAESRLFDAQYFVQCVKCFNSTAADHELESSAIAAWNSRAQLPSQGGEAVEVVAYRVSLPSEPEIGHWFDEYAESEPQMCRHEPLMTVAQHQRILAAATRPADQVADDLTMVKVSRELLEELRDAANEARNEAERPYRISFFSALVGKADALLNGGRS